MAPCPEQARLGRAVAVPVTRDRLVGQFAEVSGGVDPERPAVEVRREVGAVEPLLEVQVRAGGVAGRAEVADQVALVDVLPHDGDDLVQVAVERAVAAAVVDHHVAAVAGGQRPRGGHHAGSGGERPACPGRSGCSSRSRSSSASDPHARSRSTSARSRRASRSPDRWPGSPSWCAPPSRPRGRTRDWSARRHRSRCPGRPEPACEGPAPTSRPEPTRSAARATATTRGGRLIIGHIHHSRLTRAQK